MRDNTFSKKVFIKTVSDNLKNKYRKTIDDATQQELYQAVSEAVKDVIMDEWIATQRVMDKDDPKVVYYMSMEFLMGRALGNNLINLSAYKEVKEALNEIGVDINAIEDQEPDPALGNGGLGRLAACFMDSLSTLGYPAYGCGIRYRYGMFKQKIKRHIAEILQLLKRSKTICFFSYILKMINCSVYHTLNTLLDELILVYKMIIYKA